MLKPTRSTTDILKDRIKEEIPTELPANGNDAGGTIGSSPVASVNLRWVKDGVVYSAFVWGQNNFDDPTAIFL